MSPINKLYRGFDPIWHRHKRDIPTILTYLRLTSEIYYLVVFGLSLVVNFILKNNTGEVDILVWMLFISSTISAMLLFYLVLVYKELWYLMPNMRFDMKLWRCLFGVWMITFLLINMFQIITAGVSGNEKLFTIMNVSVNYGLLIFVVNVGLGAIGGLLLRKITRTINSFNQQFN